jgi:hypothetical protein
MAILDLRDPETRTELGLMTETVLAPFRLPDVPMHGRSRAETMDLIIEALSIHGPMTRTQLARMLGRRKTPWLVAICEELAALGLIVRGQTLINGLVAVIYGVEA